MISITEKSSDKLNQKRIMLESRVWIISNCWM